jgi:hypothetical protein
MDLGARRHYVARAMELILALLSLLTAASGALTGARAADAGLQQAVQVDTVRTLAPSAVRAERAIIARVADLPVALRTTVEPLPVLALAPAVPLYADRLIE